MSQDQSRSQWWTGPTGRSGWDRARLEQAARQLARAMAAAAETGIELGEAASAAAWGGVRGAGTAARAVWVADRPRRQKVRYKRRRRWWRRRGWWRVLIAGELIVVAAYLAGRTSWRMVRATPTVAGGAWTGAGQGWTNGRARSQTRRTSPRPGRPGRGGQPTAASHGAAGRSAGGRGRTGRARSGGGQPSAAGPGRGRGRGGPERPPVVTVTVQDRPAPERGPAAPPPPTGRGPGGPDVIDAEVVQDVPAPPAPSLALTDHPDPEPAQPAQPGPVAVPATCNWLEADGSFCGADLPAGDVFCTHHGQPQPAVDGPVTTFTAGGDPDRAVEFGRVRPGDRAHLPDGTLGRVFAVTSYGVRIVLDADRVVTVPATRRATRRPDGRPETDSDARTFDLREAGYRSWINQDGYAVDADGNRLTDAQVAAYIASGQRDGWGSPAGEPIAPTIPAGPQPAGLPGAGSPPVPQSDLPQSDQEEPLMPTATASTTLGGELTNVADLLAEVAHVQALAERARSVQAQVDAWAVGLPERVTAAPWGTAAVKSAADGVSEHTGNADLRDRISVLHTALDQADRLGESLGSIGATGSVEGLQTQ